MPGKLSTFDTLLDQEQEIMRLTVARIAACKPDVLVVEKAVARSAQEELLAKDISLVINVKMDTLERLARLTDSKVGSQGPERAGYRGLSLMIAL